MKRLVRGLCANGGGTYRDGVTDLLGLCADECRNSEHEGLLHGDHLDSIGLCWLVEVL